MNNLSWLIYVADMVGNLSGLLTGIIVMAVALTIIMGCIAVDSYDEEYKKSYGKKAYKFLKLALLCGVLSVVVPSKNTLYLIAASEMGEQVIQTETAKKVELYLNKLLELEAP